jgi:hypothetical protein
MVGRPARCGVSAPIVSREAASAAQPWGRARMFVLSTHFGESESRMLKRKQMRPEGIRFGGRTPESFRRAFEYEGRTLKGNKAQGSIGSVVGRNGEPRQRIAERSNALRSRTDESETVHQCNGEKEMDVVTQTGCCAGKSFGGCEVRVRERHGGLTITEMWSEGDCVGNGSNPTAGSRVQQTYKAVCGVNRRSWEEQQGRKA